MDLSISEVEIWRIMPEINFVHLYIIEVDLKVECWQVLIILVVRVGRSIDFGIHSVLSALELVSESDAIYIEHKAILPQVLHDSTTLAGFFVYWRTELLIIVWAQRLWGRNG